MHARDLKQALSCAPPSTSVPQVLETSSLVYTSSQVCESKLRHSALSPVEPTSSRTNVPPGVWRSGGWEWRSASIQLGMPYPPPLAARCCPGASPVGAVAPKSPGAGSAVNKWKAFALLENARRHRLVVCRGAKIPVPRTKVGPGERATCPIVALVNAPVGRSHPRPRSASP